MRNRRGSCVLTSFGSSRFPEVSGKLAPSAARPFRGRPISLGSSAIIIKPIQRGLLLPLWRTSISDEPDQHFCGTTASHTSRASCRYEAFPGAEDAGEDAVGQALENDTVIGADRVFDA